MAYPDPIPGKPRGEGWKTLAWVGGGCLVIVLAVVQLMLLGVLVNSRVVAKKMKLEKERFQIEHPTLPAWVPVYPGTAAKGAAGKREGEVAFHTGDAPDRVLDFYSDHLRANGFTVEPRTQAAQVFRLHARRRDGSELTVQSGTGNDTGTWIVLTYKNAG